MFIWFLMLGGYIGLYILILDDFFWESFLVWVCFNLYLELIVLVLVDLCIFMKKN